MPNQRTQVRNLVLNYMSENEGRELTRSDLYSCVNNVIEVPEKKTLINEVTRCLEHPNIIKVKRGLYVYKSDLEITSNTVEDAKQVFFNAFKDVRRLFLQKSTLNEEEVEVLTKLLNLEIELNSILERK